MVVWSSVYKSLFSSGFNSLFISGGEIQASVLRRGLMIHKGSKAHEGHEGAGVTIDGEEVARRVIGMGSKFIAMLVRGFSNILTTIALTLN